jgi:hypothetical protein
MGGITSAVGGIVGTVGGLIGGGKAADAAKGSAEALRAAAERASGMAQFNPYGMTTNFGTSNFADGKGSYTLNPQLQAIQNRVMGYAGAYDPNQVGQYAQPLYGGASSLFNLGGQLLPTGTDRTGSAESQALANQYRQAQQGLMPTSYQTGASPEAMAYANRLNTLSGQVTPTSYDPTAAAQEYYNQQQDLMSSGRAAEDARLSTSNFGRGTGGLGVQTGTGTAPSNPLAQALYNARSQQDRTLAGQSTDIARSRLQSDINLGSQLGAAGLSTQQQSEATNRANMLQNLGLSLGYGTQGLGASEAGTDLSRQRYAEDLRLGAGLFGTGGSLLGQVPQLTSAGYAPLETQLGLLGKTEALGQDPYKLSLDLANQYAQAGARQGQLYLQPQQAAANAYSQYQGYSPLATGLQGIGSSLQSLGNGFMAGSPTQATGTYAGRGISGTDSTGFTYANQVGPTQGGGFDAGSSGGVGSWFSSLLGGR